MSLAGSIGLAGLALVLSAALGFAGAGALFPRTRCWTERAGWGVFLALGAIACGEALALLLSRLPARGVIIALAIGLVAIAWRFRLPCESKPSGASKARPTAAVAAVCGVAVTAGVLLYLLRAMTEPMWANDFLAIWGLKGKTIFQTQALGDWPFRSADAGFSHPEYPLGLPLLYAGFSTLLGRWDDQAMALLFPAIQMATLAALFGWLRRRGADSSVAIAAVGVLALFEPLYSAFLTGMAEVPLSGTLMLVATSWSDALDRTDSGAMRRVTVASALAASLKNEGVFFAVAAGALGALGLAARTSLRRQMKVAAACVLPSLAVYGIHRAVLGAGRLRDFDLTLLRPDRLSELAGRGAAALASVWEVALRPAWPGLLCVAALLLAGRRYPAGDRVLLLCGLAVAAYLFLPILAVRGPDWLIRTTLARTGAALGPAIAAGVAIRIRSTFRIADAGESSAAATDPVALAAHPAKPRPSIPES